MGPHGRLRKAFWASTPAARRPFQNGDPQLTFLGRQSLY
jgi:hypothetical protein